jgi:pimeloyl-ACP methyl ester carboxylesterase
MRIPIILVVAVFLLPFSLLSTTIASAQPPDVPGIDGAWVGTLKIPSGQVVRIGFNFSRDEDGKLIGKWTSPDQTATSAVLSQITLENDSIHLTLKDIKGTYDAQITKNSKLMSGMLRQAGFPMSLSMHKATIYAGSLRDSSGTLRLLFKLANDDSGKRIGIMESVDEGEMERPIDSISEHDSSVVYGVSSLAGIFVGIVAPDHGRILGNWIQGSSSITLNLVPVPLVPILRRPQDPTKPYPYNEEEVSYQNKEAKISLGATLTLPKGNGPFPAVVLITGSGQQDRNETIFGHHPFWVLADYLTRRGIAVLRVDDRGAGTSGGAFDTSTTLDFASDTRAGIQYLKTRKEINKHEIGLIGHSEGGLIAPMIASTDKDVAFIVLMAGPGISSREVMHLQRVALFESQGKIDETSLKVITGFDAADSLVATLHGGNDAPTLARLDSMIMVILHLQTGTSDTSDASQKTLGRYATMEKLSLLSPWHRYFIAYDPKPALMKVHCPVLAINGSLDRQVPVKEDLDGIRSALKAGGDKNVTIVELSGLNHLFQTAKTGGVEEYPKIQETVSPLALETIGDWIDKTVKKK